MLLPMRNVVVPSAAAAGDAAWILWIASCSLPSGLTVRNVFCLRGRGGKGTLRWSCVYQVVFGFEEFFSLQLFSET